MIARKWMKNSAETNNNKEHNWKIYSFHALVSILQAIIRFYFTARSNNMLVCVCARVSLCTQRITCEFRLIWFGTNVLFSLSSACCGLFIFPLKRVLREQITESPKALDWWYTFLSRTEQKMSSGVCLWHCVCVFFFSRLFLFLVYDWWWFRRLTYFFSSLVYFNCINLSNVMNGKCIALFPLIPNSISTIWFVSAFFYVCICQGLHCMIKSTLVEYCKLFYLSVCGCVYACLAKFGIAIHHCVWWIKCYEQFTEAWRCRK